MKLLAVGDIHLGRSPTRIPEDFALNPTELGPAAAWRSAVDLAIREQVRAVLLAGDVVESERDFFEGFRELKTGIEKLTAEGIEVVAVAGNHDVEVLPRLAKALGGESGFTLLGEGGVWQSHSLEDGTSQMRIRGWSFPKRTVNASPLAGVRFDRDAGIELGLLHCDLGQTKSDYAPVTRAELTQSGLDGWLLGHIHAPHALTADNLIGYLGCLTGMDPGEPGAHGPWLIDIGEGRIREVRQLPIAPLRWQALRVDLHALEDAGDLEQVLIAEAEQLDHALFAHGPAPKAIGLRVKFVGQPAHEGAIANCRKGAHFPIGDRHYFVEHIESELLPEVSLEELATRKDPLGLLASRLLLLDRPADDPDRQALVESASKRFTERLQNARWNGLESNADRCAEEAVIEQLRAAGTAALHKLFAQQDGALG
ncbi:MAG: metallophosphoesterase [Gammaproteobacteria bacterium]|nr:metallophosphoesterase [Gammaproteobacteria bacterium]